MKCNHGIYDAGHLDSKTSIRRVLLATSIISLVFSISQGALEFVSPDESFHVIVKDYDLFGHGGMMFWFVSSMVFTLVSFHEPLKSHFLRSFMVKMHSLFLFKIYAMIALLPWTRLRERLALPTKISFYYYVGTLMLLNGVQCVGSGLLLWGVKGSGLCIVDVTTVLYYTLLTPFVYYTFLSDFFR